MYCETTLSMTVFHMMIGARERARAPLLDSVLYGTRREQHGPSDGGTPRRENGRQSVPMP